MKFKALYPIFLNDITCVRGGVFDSEQVKVPEEKIIALCKKFPKDIIIFEGGSDRPDKPAVISVNGKDQRNEPGGENAPAPAPAPVTAGPVTHPMEYDDISHGDMKKRLTERGVDFSTIKDGKKDLYPFYKEHCNDEVK